MKYAIFAISFAMMLASVTAFEAPYLDQKQNCSLPTKNGSFCYSGPAQVNDQYYSCAVPGTIAMTFDDGPTNYTGTVLDILKQFNVKATFFMIGDKISQYADVVKRVVAEGHQIGSHTYNHSTLVGVSPTDIAQELQMFEQELAKLGITIPKYFRAPHGELDSVSLPAIQNAGYTVIHWSFLSGDSYNLTSQDIVNVYKSHLGGDTGAGVVANQLEIITQQHDTHTTVVDALPDVLTYLTNVFAPSFVTVDDCLNHLNTNYTSTTVPPPPQHSSAASISISSSMWFATLLAATMLFL